MPSIELLAEVQALRDKLERATLMAALWKRLAKKYRQDKADDAMAMDAAYWEIDAGLEAKAALAALKKDYEDLSQKHRAMKTYLHGAGESLGYAQEKSERLEAELAALKKELETAQNETASAWSQGNTAKQQLAALKKDARIMLDEMTGHCTVSEDDFNEAFDRLDEATKEWE